MCNNIIKNLFFLKKIYKKKKFTKKNINISVFKKKKEIKSSLSFFLSPYRFKFGSVALKFSKKLIITQLLYKKFLLLIKKIAKKPDKTLKILWLAPSYIFRLSYKSKGARMGKGKGKRHVLYQLYKPGKPFIEISNVRIGRIFYFIFYLNLWTNNFFYLIANYNLYLSNFKNKLINYGVLYDIK